MSGNAVVARGNAAPKRRDPRDDPKNYREQTEKEYEASLRAGSSLGKVFVPPVQRKRVQAIKTEVKSSTTSPDQREREGAVPDSTPSTLVLTDSKLQEKPLREREVDHEDIKSIWGSWEGGKYVFCEPRPLTESERQDLWVDVLGREAVHGVEIPKAPAMDARLLDLLHSYKTDVWCNIFYSNLPSDMGGWVLTDPCACELAPGEADICRASPTLQRVFGLPSEYLLLADFNAKYRGVEFKADNEFFQACIDLYLTAYANCDLRTLDTANRMLRVYCTYAKRKVKWAFPVRQFCVPASRGDACYKRVKFSQWFFENDINPPSTERISPMRIQTVSEDQLEEEKEYISELSSDEDVANTPYRDLISRVCGATKGVARGFRSAAALARRDVARAAAISARTVREAAQVSSQAVANGVANARECAQTIHAAAGLAGQIAGEKAASVLDSVRDSANETTSYWVGLLRQLKDFLALTIPSALRSFVDTVMESLRSVISFEIKYALARALAITLVILGCVALAQNLNLIDLRPRLAWAFGMVDFGDNGKTAQEVDSLVGKASNTFQEEEECICVPEGLSAEARSGLQIFSTILMLFGTGAPGSMTDKFAAAVKAAAPIGALSASVATLLPTILCLLPDALQDYLKRLNMMESVEFVGDEKYIHDKVDTLGRYCLAMESTPNSVLNRPVLCLEACAARSSVHAYWLTNSNKRIVDAGKQSFLRYAAQLLHQTRDHHGQWQKVVETCGGKPETVGVLFYGAPGCGKSYTSDLILREMFPSFEIYAKTDSDAFWSGYRGQASVFWDDFATATTQEGIKAVTEVLRLISTGVPQLNMAGLEDKGACFTSKIIFASSNINNTTNFRGVVDADAIRRRFTWVKVAVREGFAKADGTLDVARINGHEIDDYTKFTVTTLGLHGVVVNEEDVTFAQLKRRIADLLEHSAERFAQRSNDFKHDVELTTLDDVLQRHCRDNRNVVQQVTNLAMLPKWFRDHRHKFFMAGLGILALCGATHHLYKAKDAYSDPEAARGYEQAINGNFGRKAGGSGRSRRAAAKRGAFDHKDLDNVRFLGAGERFAKGEIGEIVELPDSSMYTSFAKKHVLDFQMGRNTLHGVAIGRDLALVNLHFFAQPTSEGTLHWVEDGVEFTIKRGDQTLQQRFFRDNLTLVPLGEGHEEVLLDLAVLRVKGLNAADVSSRFFTKAELPFRSLQRGKLLGRMGIEDTGFVQYSNSAIPTGVNADTPLYITSHFRYNARGPGKCGLPLLLSYDADSSPMVAGMHCARCTFDGQIYGVGLAISREFVVKCLKAFPRHEEKLDGTASPECFLPVLEFPLPSLESGDDFPAFAHPGGDNFEYMGRVRRNMPRPRTALRRSALCNDPDIVARYEDCDIAIYGETDHRVTGLTSTELIAKHMAKASAPTIALPKDVVDLAVQVISMEVIDIPGGIGRLCTLDECLNGFEDEPGLGSLNLSTSPGFDWTHESPEPGKRGLIQDGVIINSKLQAAVDSLFEEESKGVCSTGIFAGCLKDEVLPASKIADRKTRAIFMAPVDYTLRDRRYFGGFVAHVFSNKLKKFSAVGMNVYSKDWEIMIKDLEEMSAYGFDGDFKGFDAYHTEQLAEAYAEVICNWYSSRGYSENNPHRRGIIKGMILALYLNGLYVFKTKTGLPSGAFLTTIVNTILSRLLTVVAFVLVYRHKHGRLPSVDCIFGSFRSKHFGDDNIVAVSPTAAYFNGHSMALRLKEFGIQYTPARKSEEHQVALRPLFELEFLSCSTVMLSGFQTFNYAAYQGEYSLFKCLLFVRAKNTDVVLATKVNAESFFLRAVSRGKAFYEKWVEKLVKVIAANGFEYTPKQYEDYKLMWDNPELQLDEDDATDDEMYEHYYSNMKPIYGFEAKGGLDYTPSVAVFEMDDGTTDAGPPGRDVQVVVLSPNEDKSEVLAQSNAAEDQSVSLAMRRGAMWESPLQARGDYPISGFLWPFSEPASQPGGALTYYSQFYRIWSGSLNISLQTNENLATTFVPEMAVPGVASLVEDIRDYAFTGFVPQSRSNNNVGHITNRVPWISTNYFTLVPKLSDERSDSNYNTGYFSYRAQNAVGPFSMSTMFVRAGDDFRFGIPYMCPRLLVGSSYFSHSDIPIVVLPELIQFKTDPTGAQLTIRRSTLLGWEPAAVPSAGPLIAGDTYEMDTFTVRTDSIDDVSLIDMGFDIKVGDRRKYDIGALSVLPVLTGFAAVVPATILLQGVVDEKADTRRGDWIVSPATLETVVEFEAHPYRIARVWSANARENFVSQKFLDDCLLTVPGYVNYIPSTFFGSTSRFISTSSVKSGLGPLGETLFYIWDDEQNRGFATPEMDTVGAVMTSVNENAVSFGLARPRGGIPEEKLDFEHLAQRRQLVQTVTWGATQPAGTILGGWENPLDLLTSNTISAGISRFVYASFDTTLTIATQSNIFQGGSLLLYYVPMTSLDEGLRTHGSNLVSKFMCPHVMIRAGGTSTVSLTVPWTYLKSAFDIRSGLNDGPLGTFYLSVLTQLECAEAGVQTATMTVTASLVNAKFHIPDPTPLPEEAQPLNVGRRLAIRALATPEGAVSTKYYNINKVVDSTIDFGNDSTSTSTEVDATLADAPNVGTNPLAVTRRAYEFQANGSNINYGETLDLEPGAPNTVVAATAYSSGPGDLSIRTQCARLTHLATVQVGVNSPVGSILYSGELSPVAELYKATEGSSIQLPYSGAFILPYTFWRGDLKFKFIWTGSPVANMRVAVVTHYARDIAVADENEAFGQYYDAHDFSSESREFEVVIPFKSNKSMLRIGKGYDADRSLYAYGSWSLRVYTKLQAPDTAPQVADIVILTGIDNACVRNVGVGSIDFQPTLYA